MRLISMVTSAAIAATALSTAAQASGNIGYVGLRGSIVQTDDGDTTSPSIDYNENYKTGFAASAFLGWVLDENFRFEIEAAYRSADIDSVYITRNNFDNTSEGLAFPVAGQAQVGAFMANLYYDIHFLGDIGVLPWIGAGIGGAYVEYAVGGDIVTPGPTITTLAARDHTSAFAYQLMAGLTVPLADSISGSIGYRFFQTSDFNYVDDFDDSFKTKLTQQSIDVGLQFHL